MSLRSPDVFFAKGEGAMSESVDLPATGQVSHKLVYVRVHFRLLTGSNADADLVISLDSAAGEEHDVTLFTAKDRGVGSDAHIVFSHDELSDPSPWAFRSGDRLRFVWAGASNIGWGLEVGYEA